MVREHHVLATSCAALPHQHEHCWSNWGHHIQGMHRPKLSTLRRDCNLAHYNSGHQVDWDCADGDWRSVWLRNTVQEIQREDQTFSSGQSPCLWKALQASLQHFLDWCAWTLPMVPREQEHVFLPCGLPSVPMVGVAPPWCCSQPRGWFTVSGVRTDVAPLFHYIIFAQFKSNWVY